MGKMRKRITQLAAVVLLLAMMMSTATFAVSFTDTSGHWAEKYIKQAAERKLIEGYLGKYRPNDRMTRAEFVTVLWRASGEPKAAKPSTFTDLTQNWYKDAIAWAQEKKVIEGVGYGKFNPDGWITREQVATILHRQAGSPVGMEVMFTSWYDGVFTDSAKVSTWAKSAVYWSVYRVIYCGEASVDVGTTLAPDAAATRGQVAVMMTRYQDKTK